jgi:hypothetical protein
MLSAGCHRLRVRDWSEDIYQPTRKLTQVLTATTLGTKFAAACRASPLASKFRDVDVVTNIFTSRHIQL